MWSKFLLQLTTFVIQRIIKVTVGNQWIQVSADATLQTKGELLDSSVYGYAASPKPDFDGLKIGRHDKTVYNNDKQESLGREENIDFDLVRCYHCPSFIEGGTTRGVGLRVENFHTGNHRKDNFMPLETIQRFLGVTRSRSLSSSKGRPSSRIKGCVIKPPS
ncbi:hypothetical protein Tco_0552819 [Tanacetum coccineum]